jgi:phage-related protein
MIDRTKKLRARFYETSTAQKPVRDWVLTFSKADRVVIGKDIQKVEFGWPIGLPSCRPLGNGLYEIRSNLSNGRIGRVLFCISSGEMVLLHSFVKKTQKMPKGDFDIGRRRQKEIEK